MVKSNAQPVVSRTERQNDTSKKWFVLSRVRNAETRAQLELDDGWDQLLTLGTEDRARDEFEWLVANANIREYVLVVVSPRLRFFDPLDDDVPF